MVLSSFSNFHHVYLSLPFPCVLNTGVYIIILILNNATKGVVQCGDGKMFFPPKILRGEEPCFEKS